MKSKFFSLSMIAAAGLFWGCYPDGADYADELDLVYTVYDENYAFSAGSTYSIPDEIVKISDGLGDDVEYIQDLYAVPMLNKIKANMTALGWTRVDADQNPDIELLPAAWTSTTIVSGGYYGGYWCYWDPYYCGGGWYYPYPYYSSYTTGTFVMFMTDPQNLSTDDSRKVVWTSAINGLLTGSYDANRINQAIDQAFAQSPYLTTN